MTAIETVTIPRKEYETLLSRLEDAEDRQAIEAFRARVAAVGFDEATKDHLPAELAWRLLDGEHPVRVWREHRGLSASALAKLAGISQSYVSEIETRKKPGSVDAYSKLARALGVPVDDLIVIPNED
jgi:antitoxin component HigA of HigAB toxin-antitoxin module